MADFASFVAENPQEDTKGHKVEPGIVGEAGEDGERGLSKKQVGVGVAVALGVAAIGAVAYHQHQKKAKEHNSEADPDAVLPPPK